MFSYDLSEKLRKKVRRLATKNVVLARIFYRKLQEVIAHNKESIDTYKNLRAPQNKFKRIHLTNKFILIFFVDKKKNKITFVDIMHWDKAYK